MERIHLVKANKAISNQFQDLNFKASHPNLTHSKGEFATPHLSQLETF
jgi:hypothetical protein